MFLKPEQRRDQKAGCRGGSAFLQVRTNEIPGSPASRSALRWSAQMIAGCNGALIGADQDKPMHLTGKPDARDLGAAGLIHRLAYSTYGGTPPVRRILLGVANRGRENWVLGGSDTSNSTRPARRRPLSRWRFQGQSREEKSLAAAGFSLGVLGT